MAVSLFFGIPRCGKTTLLTKFVYDSIKSGKYENVYANIDLNIVGYTRIYSEDVGTKLLHNGIIFIDEAAIEYDSRNFKDFKKELVRFFMMHGHFHLDIVMFSQFPDSVDKKIRAITTDCYMVYRPFITGKWFSKYYRIPYGIVIPDNGDKLGEIVQGYKQPSFLVRLFAKRVFRPRWYRYFDSWETYYLPPLPAGRTMTAERLMRMSGADSAKPKSEADSVQTRLRNSPVRDTSSLFPLQDFS